MKKRKEKCSLCGKEFETTNPIGFFCSKVCVKKFDRFMEECAKGNIKIL